MANPQERITAGQELRRRGKLSPAQDAALSELERRHTGSPSPPAVTGATLPASTDGRTETPSRVLPPGMTVDQLPEAGTIGLKKDANPREEFQENPLTQFANMHLLEGGMRITNKGIQTKPVGDASRLTLKQREALQGLGGYDPNSPPGSEKNPFITVGVEGKKGTKVPVAPVNAYKMLPNGDVVRQKGKKNQMLGLTTAIRRPIQNISRATGNAEGQAAHVRDKNMINRARLAGQEPGIVGDVAGSVVGTYPFIFATRNPYIAGGAAGAVNTDAEDVQGAVVDTATGALGGKFFDSAGKVAGSVISPHLQPAVNRLMEAGVKLTPGQMLGGTVKRVEDAATSVPIAGDMISGAQRRAQESFNIAAINEVIAPLGRRLPENTRPGHETVEAAYDMVTKEYDDLLSGMWGQLDQTAQQEMSNLGRLSNGLSQDQRRAVQTFISEEIQPRFEPSGRISGMAYKEVDSMLGQEIREYGRSLSPNDRKLAQMYREMQRQMREMFARSNPNKAPQLRAADEAYTNLLRVEGAAAAATEGVFSAQGLRTATRQMDRSLRKRQSAHGRAPMQQLADDGSAVLRQVVPESGTATRGLINAGVGAAAMGLMPALNPNPLFLAALGATISPYTRAGGGAARTVIGRRPQGANRLRQLVEQGTEGVAPYVAGQMADGDNNAGAPQMTDAMRDE